MQNKVLMIVGMHRSGTSLTSQWLSACKLHLGYRLLDANHSNQKGHYEDLDFLDYHKDILAQHAKSKKGLEPGLDINVAEDEYLAERGRSLIMLKNRLQEAWGWKEPRTCLFLDYYHTLLPNAKAIVVYRDPEEVVDSLIRRDFKRIMTRAKRLSFFKRQLIYLRKKQIYNKIKQVKMRQYQDTWNLYNKKIVQYLEQKSSEEYLVISLNKFASYEKQIFNYMTGVWKFPLVYTPYAEVFDERLLKQEDSSTDPDIVKDLVAGKILEKLRDFEAVSIRALQQLQTVEKIASGASIS